MARSLARASVGPTRADPVARRSGWGTVAAGLAVAAACLVVYLVSNPERDNLYNHFVWQASAWLEGQAGIRYPVYADRAGAPENWYFQDVLEIVGPNGAPTGRALVPFPPLPALVLLPFVAVWGLATNAQLVGAFLGGLDVALAWWVLGRLAVRPATRLLATIFFGLGTVLWYAAMLGTTWYLAHLVAVALLLLAIGIALGADGAAVAGARRALADQAWVEGFGPIRPLDLVRNPGRVVGQALPLDPRAVAAGVCLGLAATARLTVVFGLPFLLLVGGGRWPRRALSTLMGTSLPVLGLLAYNVATTGHLFHPGYEALYRQETAFYPLLYPYLEYHPDWGIEDPRYLPQNLRLMLLAPPEILPPCPDPSSPRALFDPDCPWLRPRDDGMSLLLTSPGWLLGLAALGAYGRSRLVTGAVLAVVSIALVNLMHFSQGWVQFGYRFSNDFAPFLLLLAGLGIDRLGPRRPLVLLLVAASVVVNAWGVAWGVILGW